MRRWYWWSLSRWILRSSIALRYVGTASATYLLQSGRDGRVALGLGCPGGGDTDIVMGQRKGVARNRGEISLILGRDPTGVVSHLAVCNMWKWDLKARESDRSVCYLVSRHDVRSKKSILPTLEGRE